MEAVREKWTDERLDDMNDRMGEGFDRLDKDIREVWVELSGVRFELANARTDLTAEVGSARADLTAEIGSVRTDLLKEIGSLRTDLLEEMNRRFEATHRLIIQVGGGLFGTMVIGFLGLVLTQN